MQPSDLVKPLVLLLWSCLLLRHTFQYDKMIRPDKVWRVIGGALSDLSMDPDDCGWFCYFVVSVVAKYELGGFSWLGQEVGEFLKAGCGMSRAQQFNPCL